MKTETCRDVVLQEIWRSKDELPAARGHDVHRLFAEARERQKHSGLPSSAIRSGNLARRRSKRHRNGKSNFRPRFHAPIHPLFGDLPCTVFFGRKVL